ncbi:MAG: recombinase family protein, partial [Nitrospirae bacterium]|nr:recombinase family protein [Nitrospirota bacterium]
MKAALYARVSTLDKGQDVDLQLRDLREYARARGWEVFREYADEGQSGAKDRRPALDELLADARKRRIDLVLVWRLDRLGRSLSHLVSLLREI